MLRIRLMRYAESGYKSVRLTFTGEEVKALARESGYPLQEIVEARIAEARANEAQ